MQFQFSRWSKSASSEAIWPDGQLVYQLDQLTNVQNLFKKEVFNHGVTSYAGEVNYVYSIQYLVYLHFLWANFYAQV